MNSKITFTVGTVGTVTEPLGVEIKLDGELKFDLSIIDESIPISIDVDDSVEQDHSLVVILKNKKPEHTVIDDQGNIVSDARLTVTNLTIDDINLGHVLTKVSEYSHDFNGTKEHTKEKFYGEMGCNGQLEIKFSTPIYLWLLENM